MREMRGRRWYAGAPAVVQCSPRLPFALPPLKKGKTISAGRRANRRAAWRKSEAGRAYARFKRWARAHSLSGPPGQNRYVVPVATSIPATSVATTTPPGLHNKCEVIGCTACGARKYIYDPIKGRYTINAAWLEARRRVIKHTCTVCKKDWFGAREATNCFACGRKARAAAREEQKKKDDARFEALKKADEERADKARASREAYLEREAARRERARDELDRKVEKQERAREAINRKADQAASSRLFRERSKIDSLCRLVEKMPGGYSVSDAPELFEFGFINDGGNLPPSIARLLQAAKAGTCFDVQKMMYDGYHVVKVRSLDHDPLNPDRNALFGHGYSSDNSGDGPTMTIIDTRNSLSFDRVFKVNSCTTRLNSSFLPELTVECDASWLLPLLEQFIGLCEKYNRICAVTYPKKAAHRIVSTNGRLNIRSAIRETTKRIEKLVAENHKIIDRLGDMEVDLANLRADAKIAEGNINMLLHNTGASSDGFWVDSIMKLVDGLNQEVNRLNSALAVSGRAGQQLTRLTSTNVGDECDMYVVAKCCDSLRHTMDTHKCPSSGHKHAPFGWIRLRDVSGVIYHAAVRGSAPLAATVNDGNRKYTVTGSELQVGCPSLFVPRNVPDEDTQFYIGASPFSLKERMESLLKRHVNKSSSKSSVVRGLGSTSIGSEASASEDETGTTDAACAIVVRNGTILLGRRGAEATSESGKLSPPGGKVEAGETFEMAAKRELFEESGLVATVMKELTSQRTETTNTVFFICLADGEPSVKEPTKMEEWQWFAPTAALSAPLFPGLDEVINILVDTDLGQLVGASPTAVDAAVPPTTLMTSGADVPPTYFQRPTSVPSTHKLVRVQNKDNLCCLHALNLLGAGIDIKGFSSKAKIDERGMSPFDVLPRDQVSIYHNGRWVVGDGNTPYSLLWNQVETGRGHFDALATQQQFGAIACNLTDIDCFVNGASAAVPVYTVEDALAQIQTFSEQTITTIEPTRKVEETVISSRSELYLDVPDMQQRQWVGSPDGSAVANLFMRDIQSEFTSQFQHNVPAKTGVLTFELEAKNGAVPSTCYFDYTAPQVPDHVSGARYKLFNIVNSSAHGGQWTTAVKQATCMFPPAVGGVGNFLHHFSNVLSFNNDRDDNGYIHYYERLVAGYIAVSLGIAHAAPDNNNNANSGVRGNPGFNCGQAVTANHMHRDSTCVWPAAGLYQEWLSPSPSNAPAFSGFDAGFGRNGEFSAYPSAGGAVGTDSEGNLNIHLLPLRTTGKVKELPAYRGMNPQRAANPNNDRSYWTVIANVWRAGLGLTSDDTLGLGIMPNGNCLTSDYPMARAPLVLSPMMAPASATGSQYNDAEMNNKESWRDAIAWFLINIGYEKAFYAAVHNVLLKLRFIPECVSELPTGVIDRFTRGGEFERLFLARIAIIRARLANQTRAGGVLNDEIATFQNRMWAVDTAGTCLADSNNANMPRSADVVEIVNQLWYTNNGTCAAANLNPVGPHNNAATHNMEALLLWLQRSASVNFDDMPILDAQHQSAADYALAYREFRESPTVVRFFGQMTTSEMINMINWLHGNNVANYVGTLPAAAAGADRMPTTGYANWQANIAPNERREAAAAWSMVDRRNSLGMLNFDITEHANYPCGLTLTRNQLEGSNVMNATEEGIRVAGILLSSSHSQFLKAFMTLGAQMRVVVDAASQKFKMCNALYELADGNVWSGNSDYDEVVQSGVYKRPGVSLRDHIPAMLDSIVGGWTNVGIVSPLLTRYTQQKHDRVWLSWPVYNRFYAGHGRMRQNTYDGGRLVDDDPNAYVKMLGSIVMRAIPRITAKVLIGGMDLVAGPVGDMLQTFTASFPGQSALLHNFAVSPSSVSIIELMSFMRVHASMNDEHMNINATLVTAPPAGKADSASKYDCFNILFSMTPRRSDACPMMPNYNRDILTSMIFLNHYKFDFGLPEYTTGRRRRLEKIALYAPASHMSRTSLMGMSMMPALNEDAEFRKTDDRTAAQVIARRDWAFHDMWCYEDNLRSTTAEPHCLYYSYGSEVIEWQDATTAARGRVQGRSLTDVAKRALPMMRYRNSGGDVSDRRDYQSTPREGFSGDIHQYMANQLPGNLGQDMYKARSQYLMFPSMASTFDDLRNANQATKLSTLRQYVNRHAVYFRRATRTVFSVQNSCDIMWLGSSLKETAPYDFDAMEGGSALPGVAFNDSGIPGVATSNNYYVPTMPPVQTEKLGFGLTTILNNPTMPASEYLRGLQAEKEKEEEDKVVAELMSEFEKNIDIARAESFNSGAHSALKTVSELTQETIKLRAELQLLRAAAAVADVAPGAKDGIHTPPPEESQVFTSGA